MAGDKSTLYVLITGANSGVGLGTSKRLISEFLKSKSPGTLHLTITTRSSSKSSTTLALLQKYASDEASSAATSAAASKAQAARVTVASEEQDLTNLPSVIAAASRLCKAQPRLDILICNAGISGPHIIHWPRAIWDATTAPVRSVTWPRFTTGSMGLLADKQLPKGEAEPPLGQIFCANVFGHYVFAHHLAPLLCGVGSADNTPAAVEPRPQPAKIIWVSSVDVESRLFSPEDVQGLQTSFAYQSSKRLTDLLALTYHAEDAQKYVNGFMPVRNTATTGATDGATGGATPPLQRPRMYLSHPGVVGTDILELNPIMKFLKLVTFFVARLLGSPWHTITTYVAAGSVVWLALMPNDKLKRDEERNGKGKWGSGTARFGEPFVQRTEVDGYGWGGRVGEETKYAPGRKGRRYDSVDATEKSVGEFTEEGVQCWKEMEKLRVEWERRLASVRG